MDTIFRFVEKLKENLSNNKDKYTTHEYGGGGCETCGFGRDEYDDLDMDALFIEIDEFSKTFIKSDKP